MLAGVPTGASVTVSVMDVPARALTPTTPSRSTVACAAIAVESVQVTVPAVAEQWNPGG